MSLDRRLVLLGAMVIVAVVLWLALRGGSDRPDGPEAISKVAGWPNNAPLDTPESAHNPKVAGSNPAPAIGRKARMRAFFSLPRTNGCKKSLGQRLGQHEVRTRVPDLLTSWVRRSAI